MERTGERFLFGWPFQVDLTWKISCSSKTSRHLLKSVKGNDLYVGLNVTSEFDIDLRAPKPGELEAAYKPFFDELAGRDQFLSAYAITQDPPTFTEAAILELASEPSSLTSRIAIEGLQRLATPSSRAKLLELASPVSSKARQQPSIQALGMVGNPEDCQAILAIAAASKDYTQAEAYTMAGHICAERAVPTLAGMAGSLDRQLLLGVTGGLENTHSRSAGAPLIGLLQNADSITRGNVETALATLTHRKSKYGVGDQDAAKQSHTEWLQWWSVNGSTAPIYGTDQCVAPQPLL